MLEQKTVDAGPGTARGKRLNKRHELFTYPLLAYQKQILEPLRGRQRQGCMRESLNGERFRERLRNRLAGRCGMRTHRRKRGGGW